jgi:hypothetical protein
MAPSTTARTRLPVLILLPLLLTILAFSFSLAAITSVKWSSFPTYTGPVNDPIYTGSYTRGPFGFCNLSNPNTTTTNTTVRPQICVHNVQCDIDTDDWFCQQIKVWGGALIAGAVFLGLAMIGVFVLLGIGALAPRARRRRDGSAGPEGGSGGRKGKQGAGRKTGDGVLWWWVSYSTISFLALGVVLDGVGTLEMLNLLVNVWESNVQVTYRFGHPRWNSPDAVYSVLGWIPGLVALGMLVPLLRAHERRRDRDDYDRVEGTGGKGSVGKEEEVVVDREQENESGEAAIART